MRPWTGIIPEEEERRYKAAGFGGAGSVGSRPGLLIIDVQYRTVGTQRKPYWEAIEEYPTACGEDGWRAVDHIAPLLAAFRARGLPVLYPHVAPKNAETDGGQVVREDKRGPALDRLRDRVPFQRGGPVGQRGEAAGDGIGAHVAAFTIGISGNFAMASATGITSAYFAFMSQRFTACEVGLRS